MAKKKVSSRKKSPAPATHGGGSAKGRRKTGRPLVENSLTEVVLSSSLAKGKRAFTKADNYAAVEEILETRAREYKVTLESFEATGTELRIFVRFKSRENFQGFLRVIAGLIARKVGQAKKGQPLPRKFWDHLAFTRTVVDE